MARLYYAVLCKYLEMCRVGSVSLLMVVNDMAEERKTPEREHQNITLRDRRKLIITGVHNVESFNEECVVVDTELGLLVVRGTGMHINKLDVESAALDVEGEIGVIEYLDQTAPQRKSGFLSGLFR